MFKNFLTIAALAAITAVASADFRTITSAHELMLSDIRLPVSDNGTLGISQCTHCEPGTYRVTAGTRYSVNGHYVDLGEFRRLAFNRRDRREIPVTVQHHLESDTIVEISMSLPGRPDDD